MLKSLIRVDIWLTIALISILAWVFIRSAGVTIDAVTEMKPEQVRAAFSRTLKDVRLLWLARGRPLGMGSEIRFGENLIRMNREGWPIATGAGPIFVEMTDAHCRELFEAMVGNAYLGEAFRENDRTVPVLAIGRVCVYQFTGAGMGEFSLLYNSESGEVRVADEKARVN